MTQTSLSQGMLMRASPLNLVLPVELRCQVFSRRSAEGALTATGTNWQ